MKRLDKSPGIDSERVKQLNDKEIRAEETYVLYWMDQSQRATENHALSYSIQLAHKLNHSLIVAFVLWENTPELNVRHVTFLLEGLKETAQHLHDRQIKFILLLDHPVKALQSMSKQASAIIVDRGYLRHQREMYEELLDKIDCALIQIESDVIVPIEIASDKVEYAARTIRKKLHSKLEKFLTLPHDELPPKSSLPLSLTGEDWRDINSIINSLKLDHSVKPVSSFFKGGCSIAKSRFKNFLSNDLANYESDRNQAQKDTVSHMSMYLNFGQISPVWLYRTIIESGDSKNVEAYVEELLVRRELAANYCYFQENYDSYHSLPEWAYKSLEKHKDDERPHVLTQEEMENAQTNDPVWNAAMENMKNTGYLHNYMRMYWGKRILTYTNTPSFAYKTALYLNNKYFLDGRNWNSYANIAWLFGRHDRGWKERKIFGKVRIMTPSGLKRKFKPEAFIDKVASR